MKEGSVFVVDGYGVSVNVERGHLRVCDGFPAEGARRDIRFPRGRCEVERIVIRAPDGYVTLTALDWCNRMGITIAFLGSDSRLINCLIPDGPHDGPLKRAQGVAAVMEDGVTIAQALLRRKFEAQMRAIEVELPRAGAGHGSEAERKGAIAEIKRISDGLPQDTELRDLLSREGRVAQIYWTALAGTQLPWRNWALKKIPDHWRQVWPRESGGRSRVRDARDPFNALLNYGYTLLEVEVRIACASQGLDPDLGLLHVDDRLRESAVFDILEPVRSTVDVLTLGFCQRQQLAPYMFIELRDGIVRLDPDTAEAYAKEVMPKLRRPALDAAGAFASDLRKITIPYRLVDVRTAEKVAPTLKASGHLCGYCGTILKKTRLKFCSRHCYLRHSVEVRQPIKLAQAKLARMRARGLSPGHGGDAAKKRGAKIAESNRRRSLGLTAEEMRARRSAQARKRREAPHH